ncbi:hypothetical protein HPB47_014932 [Ixodes persulcatus]|uniref:Uncharacterized protein n=1 Tax=Ixodes persulcatus TaxID=34615 RepID=A0AC60R3I4_IXOPE|nr:hypothetical protein HPB47_014932 [Ixodes persulcatus]
MTMYLAPNLSRTAVEQYIDEAMGDYQKQYADTHPFILIGDFNVNVMKSHWIVEYMSSHHSLQHVLYDDRKQQPTTIHGTCIDHVFTNFKIHPLHQDPFTVHFSDHKAILIKAKCTPQSPPWRNRSRLTTKNSGSIADDNQGAFQDVVRGTKRRCPSQASGSSEKTIITQTEPTVGLVVLFTPVDGDVRIDSINSVRLTSTLETLVPSCVIEVRYNRRKNLLAIDTRNGQTTRTLLGQTTLCGMKVRAFEPRGKASSVGIVRDIDSTLSDSTILGVLRSTVGICNVRRIGKSTTIRVEFASPTLPEHVYVGLVRHGVDLSTTLFNATDAVCLAMLRLFPHATTKCKGSSTLCVNCKKPHETTSQQCPFWQAERSVCRYRCENNVSFAEARAQVGKRTAERAAPRAEAATEMVVLTETLQRRRRHSRRRKAEQPVADKQDPSSSLVAEAPKPMDTEPPPKEAPVLVSSGENIGGKATKQRCKTSPHCRHHQFRPDLYSRPLKLLKVLDRRRYRPFQIQAHSLPR